MPPFVFEVSWEVCHPIGGIYQVLRSKAPFMVERWRHRYCLVGPYVPESADVEFEPLRTSGWLGAALDSLAEDGHRAAGCGAARLRGFYSGARRHDC